MCVFWGRCPIMRQLSNMRPPNSSTSSEIEVFMSAVRWLWHEWPSRKPHIQQVMSCVRFGLIAPWQLVDIKRNPENPPFLEITSHPAVQSMIENGLAFAIIKYWYGNQTSDYFHWIEVFGLTEPPGRNWMNWAGEEKNYVAYKEFLSDLVNYRKTSEEQEESLPSNQETNSKIRDASPFPQNLQRPPLIKMNRAQRQRNASTDIVNIMAYTGAEPLQEPPYIWNTDTSNAIVESIKVEHYKKQLYHSLPYGPTKVRSKSRMRKKEEAAAKVIQIAFRQYKNKKKSVPVSSTSATQGRSQRSQDRNSADDRACRPSMIISPPITPRILRRQYLRDGSLYLLQNESILVLGGADPQSNSINTRCKGKKMFWYHSGVNTWQFVGELPEPRHHHAVAFYRGRIYLAGGGNPQYERSPALPTVWSFEPASRSWLKEGSLNTSRKNFGLVATDGKLFAVGGQDETGRITATVERYDEQTQTWEYVSPMTIGRTGAAVGRFKESVWVAGGLTDTRRTPLTATVETYDPKKNRWSNQSTIRFPRCHGCLFAMDDVLYLIGGAGRVSGVDRHTSSCNAVDVWSPKDRQWQLHFAMAIPRHGHSVAYIGPQLFVIGGVSTAYMRALADVECFCCRSKSWVRDISELPEPLSGHCAVTIPPACLM